MSHELAKSKSIVVGERLFNITAIGFSNGCLLAVSEGRESRFGALMLALRTGEKVDSSTIIPGRYGGIFLSILANACAEHIRGIVLTSLYVTSEVNQTEVLKILAEVKTLLEEVSGRVGDK
jgi:hypothetical protein